MAILERLFGARRPRQCPVCGAGRRNIGVAVRPEKAGPSEGACAAASLILSCGTCGSRWTPRAIAAGWQPRIRITVFRREQTRAASDEPEEVCEVLSDGVDGLLKVKEAAEKDELGKLFGVPNFRFTHGGQLSGGEMYDAGRVFGAWEEENLRHVAFADLLCKPYYVGQFICDGTEDPYFRERAEQVRAFEADRRKAKQPPTRTPAGNGQER